MQKQTLGSSNIYNALTDIKTPLLELQKLLREENLSASQMIADQIVTLFDVFLYAQKLEQSLLARDDFSYHSLSASTEEILHKISPLAKLYDIKLTFECKHPKKMSVSLIKPAFDHATYSLLCSLLNDLHRQKQKFLYIKASCNRIPNLRFFNPNQRFLNQTEMTSPNKVQSKNLFGLGGGLILANAIYRFMGSHINLFVNQTYRGLGVDFKASKQMTLVESLSRI
ncbi:MAG: hypothetical protein OXF49_00075 [Candidatus Saccharibacteria bacterium]|nr:hypothetical protein [Candidatus Saccharibacteria bacterium]